MRTPFVRVAFTALFALTSAAGAAPPAIPDQVPFSGNVPGGGTGSADLTVRIYDAATSGTLLYVQNFTAVPLVEGEQRL